MKKFFASLCLLVSMLMPLASFASVRPEVAELAARNTVTIYSQFPGPDGNDNPHKECRGAGVVYYVDQTSTYIATAAHLKDAGEGQPDHFIVYFADGESAEGFVTICMTKSDEMIIHVPTIAWRSFSGVRAVKDGDPIFAFKWQAQYGPDGHISNFFDRKLTKEVLEGSVIGDPQILGLSGYETGSNIRYFYMQFMDIISHPGMSGSGVFDENGFAVGIINGGNHFDSVFTPIISSFNYENMGPGQVFVPWFPREILSMRVLFNV